jgi:hypothetical protein
MSELLKRLLKWGWKFSLGFTNYEIPLHKFLYTVNEAAFVPYNVYEFQFTQVANNIINSIISLCLLSSYN